MRKITKFDTNQLLDILNLRAQKELSKTDARLASAFFFQYFKRVPQEDLRGENSDDLYKLATAHLNSARQKKHGQVQVQIRDQLFREQIGLSRGIARVDPHHVDIRLGLDGEMQNHGLVGAEVGGHDRLAAKAHGPVHDLLGVLAGKFVVGVLGIDVHG